jgi:hypothetical protein
MDFKSEFKAAKLEMVSVDEEQEINVGDQIAHGSVMVMGTELHYRVFDNGMTDRAEIMTPSGDIRTLHGPGMVTAIKKRHPAVVKAFEECFVGRVSTAEAEVIASVLVDHRGNGWSHWGPYGLKFFTEVVQDNLGDKDFVFNVHTCRWGTGVCRPFVFPSYTPSRHNMTRALVGAAKESNALGWFMADIDKHLPDCKCPHYSYFFDLVLIASREIKRAYKEEEREQARKAAELRRQMREKRLQEAEEQRLAEEAAKLERECTPRVITFAEIPKPKCAASHPDSGDLPDGAVPMSKLVELQETFNA